MQLVYSVYKLTDENMLQWIEDFDTLKDAYLGVCDTDEWENAELCIQENWIFSKETPKFE